MPLPIPKLDDRRFKELSTFLRDQIPGFTKAWTDFNPSDSGIMLLELWCWLAEMIFYRIDQIPQRNYTNFFKFILDPPEPVTTTVFLTIYPQFSDRDMFIPLGIRFAAKLLSPPECPPEVLELFENGQVIFETYEPTRIPVMPLGSPPELSPFDLASPPEFETIDVSLRSKVVVKDEKLGVSTGQPDQIFYLQKGPVLLDENNISTELYSSPPDGYNPNPRIWVKHPEKGDELWEYVPDFLEAATGPESEHFVVEQLSGGVRFGNRVKGKIPPAEAEIWAEQYQIILGKEVKIGTDVFSKESILDIIPELPLSDILDIKNDPAEGGDFIYSPEEVWSTGLKLYKQKFRAITAEDFEELATTQFNEAQESCWVAEAPDNRVARAVAVAGKDLRGTPPFPEQPATISVIILPRPQTTQEVRLVPSEELKEKVFRFLDRRRLITTRVYVAGPEYAPVSLDIEVVREARTNDHQVNCEIYTRIQHFFHPLTGGDQKNGWPFGRDVYKSELYQLIEAVEGVDHVKKIVMNGNSSANPIVLTENQLPFVETITVNHRLIRREDCDER